MCSISGVWHWDGQAVAPAAFDRFVDALAHRGPDGRGVHIDSAHQLALGHRLLAIQGGQGEGAQPMQLGGRYWITFNGEVFNYRELRDELVSHGHCFHTDTDTEVVLAAYAQWGERCQLRFNGMWAMAIWDRVDASLFVSVDRFAVKSCVYYAGPDYFAFASEIKAFTSLERHTAAPAAAEVARILHSGEESTTATLLRDVYRLPAGHSLTIRRGRPVAAVRWWHTLDHLPRPPSGAAAQTERFLELLGSAVDLRLSGNAKIAIPLSGGMDSSAILALACEHRQRLPDIAAFFIRKSGVLDEEKFAMSMAAHAGIAPVVIAGSAELSVAMLEARALACESFTLGSEGPMALYRAVRDSGAKVTLDGHGGDELLGGYPRYLEPAIDDALGGMPDPLRLLQLAAINRGLAAGSESLTLFKGWENTRQRLRAGWRRRWADPADPAATGAAQAPPGFDGLNSALYHDVHHGFLQKILRTFDYSSMAYGVEARTPFLDWRLVTYAFALPSTAKIGARHTKSILRKAMRGRMPDDVLYRRSKVGFIEANRYFLNPAVVDWIGDQLADAACQQSALWDGRQIAAAYARWRQGPRNAAVGRRLLTVAQAHFVLGRICAGQAAGQAAGALADVA